MIALLAHEGGKTLDDGIAEIREAADFCRYYAAEARRLFGQETILPGPTGEENRYRLRGRGVFVCISPWNFPLAIFIGQVAAALAAGNAVVAKPAEQTPLIAFEAVQAACTRRAFPPTRSTSCRATARSARRWSNDPRIAGVAFTGSTEVAQKINRALAAKDGPIVPLIAETGGINAMIADATALPEQVADDVVTSAFRSAGQRCSACAHPLRAGGRRRHDARDDRRRRGRASPRRPGRPGDGCRPGDRRATPSGRSKSIIEKMRREQTILFAGNAPKEGLFVAPHIVELRRRRRR